MAASVQFLLLLALLTLTRQTFCQRLSFLRLPPSVSLSSDAASTPLDSDQLEPLIANLIGLPTNLKWSKLTSFASLDRPKANLLFVVEGAAEIASPSDLGFHEDSVRIKDADSEDVFESFRGLGLRLQSTFHDSPLLLFNDPVEPEVTSSSGSVNAALEFGANAVNRLEGALKMSSALRPLHLNVSLAPDAGFFQELGQIQLLVDTLSNAAVKSLVKDATPDLFLFRFRSVKAVSEAYGGAGDRVDEMKALLKKFIEKVKAEVESIYDDQVVVELIALPEARDTQLIRKERAASDADAATPAPGNDANNIAGPYNWSYAATFNMSIWTGVLLIVIVYLIAFGMWNMDPGRDGYVYRLTMSKNQ